MKKVLTFIGLLCIFFLSGCVEYRESLVFNPDWSGNLTFSIGINEQFDDFQEEDIKQRLDQVNGLEVLASKTYYQGNMRWVEFDVEFNNLEALTGMDEAFNEVGFIGKITIEEDDKGNILYTRKLEKEASADTQDEMVDNILSQFYWTYRTKFPEQVISANAGENNIDRETNTIKWKINLAALISNPQIMSATIKQPQTAKIVWPLIILGIVALLVLVLGLYLYVLKGRKNRLQYLVKENNQAKQI